MTDELENFDDFDTMEFADNPDPRCPIVVVLDCSDSMTDVREGQDRSPLDALNGGLDRLVTSLHEDPLARSRAEVSFVTYGTEATPATDFKTADELILPGLAPMGITSTGAALNEALDALEDRKKTLDENGIQRYRSIVLWISDGLSTDSTEDAKRRIAELRERKKVALFPVAVEGADEDDMGSIAGSRVMKLQGVKFDELFQWLSASAASVSASQPGDAVAVPPVDEWAEL